jgi:hypothetical protein
VPSILLVLGSARNLVYYKKLTIVLECHVPACRIEFLSNKMTLALKKAISDAIWVLGGDFDEYERVMRNEIDGMRHRGETMPISVIFDLLSSHDKYDDMILYVKHHTIIRILEILFQNEVFDTSNMCINSEQVQLHACIKWPMYYWWFEFPKTYSSILASAVIIGIPLMKYLKDNGCQFVSDHEEQMLFRISIQSWNTELFELLVRDWGLRPSENNLMLMAITRRGRMFDVLFKNGFVPSIDIFICLVVAHADNIACKMVSKIPDIERKRNVSGGTLLHRTILSGMHNTAMQIMHRYPSLAYLKDNDGYTPSMLAAKCDNVKVLTTLIALGANIMSENRQGYDAFSVAVQYRRERIIKVLLPFQIASRYCRIWRKTTFVRTVMRTKTNLNRDVLNIIYDKVDAKHV